MLYCPKCRTLCPEGSHKCPACRSSKLRPPAPQDWVLLLTTDLHHAQQLEELLDQSSIGHQAEELGRSAAFYDSHAMPTDQRLFVPYGDLPAAQTLAAQLEAPPEEPQEAPPPTAKRLAGEVVSILVFLLLVMLAVFGADAFTNWLKSLF